MKNIFYLCLGILLVLSLVPAAVGCGGLPQVLFEASVTSGQAPLTVVFTNQTDAAPDSNVVFKWDFGDGQTAETETAAASVTHEYTRVGAHTVTVTASTRDNPEKTNLSTLTITVSHGTVDSVELAPATVELSIGGTQSYTAEVLDSGGNVIPGASLSWEAEAGTITDQGVFTAGTEAGVFEQGVTADAALDAFSAIGSASVTIKPDPLDIAVLSTLEIAAGGTNQLEAIAKDQYGNEIEGLEATWSMNNTDLGSITAEGVYTAPKKAGSYPDAIAVEVKQGDTVRQAVGNVTVVPASLSQLVTGPVQIELGLGMTQQFVAVGADEYGNRITGLDFTWSIDGGGTISAGGLFTAGEVPGTFRDIITVTAVKDGVTRTATAGVTIEPDRVIFLSNRADEQGLWDVYVMDIDGSNVKKLNLGGGGVVQSRIVASPDGRRFMYTNLVLDTFIDETILANVDGTWQTLVVSGRNVFEPSWSPDGQTIAFQSWEHDPSEIYLMDVDGGNFRRLTENNFYDDYPNWSPNGNKIVFISERTGSANPKIWVMNADGSAQTQITSGNSYDLFPQWSPDGTEILFQSDRSPAGDWGLFIMNADGTNLRPLYASGSYSAFAPIWSPDGTRIVFNASIAGAADDIYIIDRDGTNLTQLTENTAVDFSPTWLPRKRGVEVTAASVVVSEDFDIPALTAQEITAMAGDAVVRIVTEMASGTVSGSGFVIESDGLVLTNNHMVIDAETITVYLKDGTSYEGTVEARDMVRDLALVRIGAAGLHALDIGDLSGISPGQSVMVLGYPLGNENVSVTSGLVSSIEFDDGRNITWVQTDSAINPGNSGGPLLDMHGRVIGIIAIKAVGIAVEGIGYAISANTINLYLPSLLAQ